MSVPNRGPHLLVVCAIMVSMAFVSTSLRCYVRLRMVKAFGIDDWFMLAATLTFVMFATCAIGGIHYGTGRHMADLTPESTMKAMRYWWLCYVAYCLTMISAKLSIGFFLLRLTIHRMQIWIIWIAMMLTVICGAVFFFVTLFQCSPISFFWDQALGAPGQCINIDIIIALTYLYGSVSAITDFTFGILPIFLVWNLNMERKVKIALVPILSMACIASSAVIVRMAYVQDFRNPDFLWATVDIAIWSDTEQGLAITAGSLATLRPLFQAASTKLKYAYGTDTSNSGRKSGTPKPQTVWPSENSSRSRNPRKGGPWSLLRTEAGEGDVELMEAKSMGTMTTTTTSLPGGLTTEEMDDVNNKRKSWWRVSEHEHHEAGDGESLEEVNRNGSRGMKTEAGAFV